MSKITHSEAATFLKLLELLGFPAVIAGGFARDHATGRDFRDIDLYCSADHACALFKNLSGLEEVPAVRSFDQNSAEYRHQSIEWQHEFSASEGWKQAFPILLKDHPINLIAILPNHEVSGPAVVSRFNIGLCQAYITTAGFGASKAFLEDLGNKQMTLLRTDWGHEGTMKMWLKLQKKYPWPLVVA